ncbi:MAG: outer membrane beta-barrel protein [Bacteroidetes bacterium]|nr:outer membrane beta-barrel protein [Bacteroidota bacterium]MBS1539955.1 outer membrane beta-barrel protein [Bacteroidota bacterium]
MKQLVCIACLLLSVASQAQEYKKFKVGIGAGGAAIHSAGGSAFFIEPAYRLNDNIAVGFKMEALFVLGGTNIPAYIGSQSINAQYYFSGRTLHPFVGAGAGIYNMNNKDLFLCDCSSNYEKNIVGFYPRVGFDYGHLTFNIEYNFMPPVKNVSGSIIPNSGPGAVTVKMINANYMAAKVGLSVGGGKKKKP